MQSSRASARTEAAVEATAVYPSRPPHVVEPNNAPQQPRGRPGYGRQPLRRQKEPVEGAAAAYDLSAEESSSFLVTKGGANGTEKKTSSKRDNDVTTTSQNARGRPREQQNRRPVLQRQQHHLQVDDHLDPGLSPQQQQQQQQQQQPHPVQAIRTKDVQNVHFKEVPEYYSTSSEKGGSSSIRHGTYNPSTHTLTERSSVYDTLNVLLAADFPHLLVEESSSLRSIPPTPPCASDAIVYPSSAEALLGTSPTSSATASWALRRAQRRALPTTVESYDDDEEATIGGGQQEDVFEAAATHVLVAEELEEDLQDIQEEGSYRNTILYSASKTTSEVRKNVYNNNNNSVVTIDPSPRSQRASPAGSGGSGSGRILPHVPKRYVVPRVSARDYQRQQRSVSFDENEAVTHLGECENGNNDNENNQLTSADDQQPAADLIDIIGPAPSTKAIMVKDNYGSLNCRRSSTRTSRFDQYKQQADIYGTYRRHNNLESYERLRSNFATAFNDEFDAQQHSITRALEQPMFSAAANDATFEPQEQQNVMDNSYHNHHQIGDAYRDCDSEYNTRGYVNEAYRRNVGPEDYLEQPEQQQQQETYPYPSAAAEYHDEGRLAEDNLRSVHHHQMQWEATNDLSYQHNLDPRNHGRVVENMHQEDPAAAVVVGGPLLPNIGENGFGMMGPGYDYYQQDYQQQTYQQQQQQQQPHHLMGRGPESQPFLGPSGHHVMSDGGPVQLTPSWEERNVSEDQLNFRTLSVSMDRLDLEMNPPTDRLNLIYLTLILHGIGTLMPWNMFITAKELKRGDWVYMLTEYFVNYKLGKEHTDTSMPYATYFLQYVGFAAQVPNLIFNWVNIFLNIGGNLTSRIVWTLLLEVIVFVLTIILAMIDTSEWPGLFFYLTIGCIVIMNVANGIYQNTVYGLAAKLPFKYTGAVVLGSNLSGTIVSVISIISLALSPNPRTAAIYYFITALFILLACFDTYFALPLNRFFRYHDHQYTKALQERKKRSVVHAMPYGLIFKQCFPQCFNVFFTYFVTLAIFPAVLADVNMAHDDFPISTLYYTPVTCFLTFNVCAVLGNLIPMLFTFPSPRWLFIPVVLRFIFIPFFLLCNYRPSGVERLWPALIHWDYAYWGGAAAFGLTGGYFSSVAMMYCPRSVEPEYASVAGMFGAASIVTGICAGIAFSYLMPIVVSDPSLTFEAPGWWPTYIH